MLWLLKKKARNDSPRRRQPIRLELNVAVRVTGMRRFSHQPDPNVLNAA